MVREIDCSSNPRHKGWPSNPVLCIDQQRERNQKECEEDSELKWTKNKGLLRVLRNL